MNRTALITGAPGGLGAEFARIHASKGDNLVLVARGRDKMNLLKEEIEKKYNVSVYILGRDLSDPGSAKSIYTELKNKQIRVDYLINNAGFGDFGHFEKSNWDKQLQMINLNIITLTYMTRLFLPDMIENKYGKVLNVASTAAFQPGPTMSVYFATKAFVLSFSEAIANEVKGKGVTVTALCPGATATNFKNAASMDNSRLFKGKIATSYRVSLYGYNAMMRGQTVAIHGLLNKIMAFSVRFTPRNLITAITRKMVRTK